MKTQIKVPFGLYWSRVIMYRIGQQFRLLTGKITRALIKNMHEYETYMSWQNRVNSGPLTTEQVADLVEFQVEKVSADRGKRSKNVITEEKLAKPLLHMQHLGAKLLREVLRKHPMKSVMNIGARVDLTSSFLAPQFPKVRFISVDLQPNLRWYNELLPIADNQEFVSGYALDLLKDGLAADVIYMTSTSVLFNAAELDEYIRNLNCQYLVLNEPWFPNFKRSIGGLECPEDIAATYCSGAHFNFHHNYVGKLEAAGWTVEMSQIVPADDVLALQIVARR